MIEQQEQPPYHPKHVIIGAKLVYLLVIMLWLMVLYAPSYLWFNAIFSSAFKG
jgi:polyferredoxin